MRQLLKCATAALAVWCVCHASGAATSKFAHSRLAQSLPVLVRAWRLEHYLWRGSTQVKSTLGWLCLNVRMHTEMCRNTANMLALLQVRGQVRGWSVARIEFDSTCGFPGEGWQSDKRGSAAPMPILKSKGLGPTTRVSVSTHDEKGSKTKAWLQYKASTTVLQAIQQLATSRHSQGQTRRRVRVRAVLQS